MNPTVTKTDGIFHRMKMNNTNSSRAMPKRSSTTKEWNRYRSWILKSSRNNRKHGASYQTGIDVELNYIIYILGNSQNLWRHSKISNRYSSSYIYNERVWFSFYLILPLVDVYGQIRSYSDQKSNTIATLHVMDQFDVDKDAFIQIYSPSFWQICDKAENHHWRTAKNGSSCSITSEAMINISMILLQ